MSEAVRTTSDIRNRFAEAGFEVAAAGSGPVSFEVKKYNCSQLLVSGSEVVRPSGPPNFIVQGVKCELEDRGYQKFWYSAGKRFPIRQGDLKALHQFDEEVRNILCLKSLYNEALGSTSARTVYDRLEGRPDK